jgi:glycosyltransferase involved in cell wall biosynthesis
MDFFVSQYRRIREAVEARNKFNVLVPFWELYEYPDEFQVLSRDIHVFLAMSRFIQYSLMRVVDNVQIEYMPHGIYLESRPGKRIEQDKKGFRFFYNFDINSTIERKNPDLVINSFLSAFQGDDEVELELKVSGLNNPASSKILTELESVSRNRKIRVVKDFLPRHEMLRRIAQADCYISCHRSEGLGLGLLEAMALGVPCIATGFGGNTDFTNNNNSIVLRYDLRALEDHHYRTVLGKSDRWAEPKMDEVVDAMRLIRLDGDLRRRLAENAKRDAEKYISEFSGGSALDAIFACYRRYTVNQSSQVRLQSLVR